MTVRTADRLVAIKRYEGLAALRGVPAKPDHPSVRTRLLLDPLTTNISKTQIVAGRNDISGVRLSAGIVVGSGSPRKAECSIDENTDRGEGRRLQ